MTHPELLLPLWGHEPLLGLLASRLARSTHNTLHPWPLLNYLL